MTWEFDFLYFLQEMHTDLLDKLMVSLTTFGNAGIFWIVLTIVLVAIPKTRKCGLTSLIAMVGTYILGNLILKNVIARPRPFTIDPSVELLVKKPFEYSFPSGHTMNGFTVACCVFYYYKLPGVFAILLAGAIAFSRMYLFVHYPTDIMGGIAIGVLDSIVAYIVVKRIYEQKSKASKSGD